MTSAVDDLSELEMVEIEQLPSGWETARVTFTTSSGEERKTIQIIDHTTILPMQYWHDSMHTISLKCASVVLALPFFAVANMTCSLVRMPVLIATTFGSFIQSAYNASDSGKVGRLFVEWTQDVMDILIQGTVDICKVPFYAVKMQLCCVYGIFFPMQGRKLAGQTERAWHGSERSYDLNYLKWPTTALEDLARNKNSPYCIYLAFCFQPIRPALVEANVSMIEILEPGTKVSKL